MALSRSSKIIIFLTMDVVFFLVELIIGYTIGSLALVADSFHMLNDVLSLLIALYAIKLSTREATDSRLSYGWNRAEILAALTNGVFLIALCFSIAVEAIQRFTSIHEISHPELLVIVGAVGFFSNVLGLLLFHEHGNSDSPSQDQTSPSSDRAHSLGVSEHSIMSPQVPPTTVVTRHRATHGLPDVNLEKTGELASKYSENVPPIGAESKRLDSWIPPLRSDSVSSLHKAVPSSPPAPSVPLPTVDNSFHTPPSRKTDSWLPSNLSRPVSQSSLYGYPPATRAMLIQTAQDIAQQRRSRSSSIDHSAAGVDVPDVVMEGRESTAGVTTTVGQAESPKRGYLIPSSASKGHHHRPQNRGHHGHAHGSMNMRSLVLHILGDALGNIGVVSAGLMIWFAKGKFKYYFDPMISLVITAIIFSSALPLVRSAGFILLQATPTSVSVEDVEEGILAVDGVLSFHELHVWQLSESKLVGSVHVATSRTHDFMKVAVKIRKVLHDLGIHSCTIQPEYDHPPETVPELSKSRSSSCLILCPSDQKCDPRQHSCCPPKV